MSSQVFIVASPEPHPEEAPSLLYRYLRHSQAGFITHLLATHMNVEQSRVRRRCPVDQAALAYARTLRDVRCWA